MRRRLFAIVYMLLDLAARVWSFVRNTWDRIHLYVRVFVTVSFVFILGPVVIGYILHVLWPDHRVIIQNAWGSGDKEVGRQNDPESNPVGPMAIRSARQVSCILDQVNKRLKCYDNEAHFRLIDMPSSTVDDVAISDDGHMALLDSAVAGVVYVLDPTGALAGTLTIAGQLIDNPSASTAVFVADGGVWVEVGHGKTVEIGDSEGHAVSNRRDWPGRPGDDITTLLRAEVEDQRSGIAEVFVYRRSDNALKWSQTLTFTRAIVEISSLDSDKEGNVYLGVTTADQQPIPPYDFVMPRLVVVCLASDGTEVGRIDVEPASAADEQSRPVTVVRPRTIDVLRETDNGVAITRYDFDWWIRLKAIL